MKFIDKIDKWFLILSTFWLFVIMIIVAIDGLLRQFLGNSITGAYVLVENYLMVAMVFPAMGYTWAKKGHISITIVQNKMPNALRNITYFLILLIGIYIMGVIGYTGFEKVMSAFISNHVTSGLIRWPLWIAYIWIPLGAAVFCLRLIIEFTFGILQIVKEGFGYPLVDIAEKTKK